MPFLRFSRDKRGYESTYLCHSYRQSGTQDLRVLYWFRTPPGVRVGRLALDPKAIRAIEEANPRLKFDWDKILKVKAPPPPQEYDREAREERRAKRRRRAASEAESEIAVAAEGARGETPGSGGAPPGPAEPCPEEPSGEPKDSVAHVALALTDGEGLARLRARHATIVARIGDRKREPEKLAALQAQAALIDPDSWKTVEEARERVAALDETTEALRRALGRRPRRRRGGSGRRRGAASGRPDTAGSAPGAKASEPTPAPADGSAPSTSSDESSE
ncbi:MAG: hypothetical protein CL483_13070 [Acidobacteria bacterium]|nr:hypothetical protein [Acidobacteriota bacterium]